MIHKLFLYFSISATLSNGLIFKGKKCHPTSHDVYGPYYIPNPPPLLQFCTGDNKIIESETLLVHGKIFESDCETPMPFVRMEIWQADHDGNYQMSTDCRGFLNTDQHGYYEFTTLHPGKYKTDPDSHLFRPAHLHFKIFGQHDHKDLVTQMYFYGDTNLGWNDSCHVCSSDRKDLIVKTLLFCDGEDLEECTEIAEFNIVLEKGQGTSVTIADYDYEYR
ncbi:pcaH [Mytilus coruscus]|uniref:PcaH n=1 Tax=Mytilus coruscus TaxID=42192 RepID=A0A6J8AFP9_MYTCO|nr:pcaH [Mytilus coruscus]